MLDRSIQPAGPVEAYKTYEIKTPRATHWRPATCEEYECESYLYGWQTQIDPHTTLGGTQDYYIRKQSGRKFVAESQSDGTTIFTFEAGQKCFAEHQLPIGRPELFLVADGDFRGNPTGRVRRHVRAEDWIEDFALHQQGVEERQRRG